MSSENLLRQKVRALMDQHQYSQMALADRLKKSQAWLSRRLTGVQNFQVRDLDKIANVFAITVPELFFDEYGQWDRRSGSDRRKGERRKAQRVFYDAKLEIQSIRDRLDFPPKYKDR